jgi:hypothetical protein
MIKKALSLAVLTLCLTGLGCSHPAPPPYPAPPPPGAIANEGYHDGAMAARRDIARALPPDVRRHPRFRTPPAPPGQPAQIYRRNFRRGYQETFGRY